MPTSPAKKNATPWAAALVGKLKRNSGLIGAVTGVVAAGVGAGIALEKLVVGRAKDGRIENGEALGSWRGRPVVVTADDGVELYAEVDEPDTGDREYDGTLVFCHAYALNLDEWYFQRRELAPKLRVVAYDQRSHGRSGRADSASSTVDQLGRDLSRVLDELVPDGPIVLVGHSMGGMTIMALAADRPELFGGRVVGVGLIATSAGDLSGSTLGLSGAIGKAANRVAPSFVAALSRAPQLVEHGRRAGSDVGYLITRHYSFGSKVPAARTEFVVEMLAGTPIDVVADFYPTFGDHDRRDTLAPLEEVDTVIFGGGKDLITSVEHSRVLADLIPGATYHELTECGHMIQLEYPELVNEELHALVRRVLSTPGGTVAVEGSA